MRDAKVRPFHTTTPAKAGVHTPPHLDSRSEAGMTEMGATRPEVWMCEGIYIAKGGPE